MSLAMPAVMLRICTGSLNDFRVPFGSIGIVQEGVVIAFRAPLAITDVIYMQDI